MSEARMATEEDFKRELMRLPAEGGISNHYPHPFNTGGDDGPHMRGFTVPMETIVGQFTRATLADGLRLIGTPKDEPNLIAELWDRSLGEPHGEMVILPQRFTFSLDPAVTTALQAGMMTYVGQTVTEELVKRVIDDVTARVSEACGYVHPNPKTTFENDPDAPVVVERK